MPTTINANSITLPSGDVVTDEGCVANFGAMFGETNPYQVASNEAYGYAVRATRVWIQKNIRVSIAGNTIADRGVTWDHKYTGVYAMHLMYRQQEGGDIWTNYAITKNGFYNVAGTTARMGSQDSQAHSMHAMYVVDDVDAVYSLRGWTQTTTRTIGNSVNYPEDAQNPIWNEGHSGGFAANNRYLSWRPFGSRTMEGRILDVNIYRVSPL
jgi:hypothetical protein